MKSRYWCSISRDFIRSPWPHFYQTRSAWSVDQGSNKNHSPAYNFAPTVTKFCVMWEGLSLPHDTKVGNCRCKIVDSRAFPSWSLIHGLRWSGLIKAEPGIPGWVIFFVPIRTPPPPSQILVHAITFEQLFGLPSFWHNWWPWTIYLLLIFWSISVWPWPWIFKVKYRIFYISAKYCPIATKRKSNIWIEL